RFDGTRFVNFTTADGLVANDVITVTVTPDGSIWFGTRTGGVSKYDPQHFAQFDVADGLLAPNSPAANMGTGGAALLVPDGALWFASGLWRDNQRGLVRYDGRGFEQVFSAFRNTISALALGKDNSIWLGLRRDGLLHYSEGRSRLFTQADGLPSNDVASLVVGNSGELWVGTYGDGLARYDGQAFKTFSTGLPAILWALAVDASSNLWIGTT